MVEGASPHSVSNQSLPVAGCAEQCGSAATGDGAMNVTGCVGCTLRTGAACSESCHSCMMRYDSPFSAQCVVGRSQTMPIASSVPGTAERWRRKLAIAGAVAVLGVLVSACVWWWRRSRRGTYVYAVVQAEDAQDVECENGVEAK